MLSPDQLDRLRTVFPGFKDPALLRQLEARGQYVRLDAAQTICHQGDSCSHLALVTEGLARVYKLAETGREITLYRVTPGECCILTASCILSGQHFPAYATSESPVEGVLVPVDAVTAWMGSHPEWRGFIWKLMADRLGDVISLVEEVAFRRMDQRIVEYVLERCTSASDGTISATHQDIAAELGTSREVVSRILKDLEQRGHIRLGRGRINAPDLGRLSGLLQQTLH